MRFSARISTEEQKFSDSSCYEESSAFEMENIVHTIKLPPSGAGMLYSSSNCVSSMKFTENIVIEIGINFASSVVRHEMNCIPLKLPN